MPKKSNVSSLRYSHLLPMKRQARVQREEREQEADDADCGQLRLEDRRQPAPVKLEVEDLVYHCLISRTTRRSCSTRHRRLPCLQRHLFAHQRAAHGAAVRGWVGPSF